MSRKLKNVTITLDEETARWARIEAARHDTSVSRFVGEMLREQMEARATYEAAHHQFVEQGPYLTAVPGRTLPSRDELHARPRLR